MYALGFVKLNITPEQLQRAEKLRLVFHATESTYNTSYLQPIYCNQLFGSQKILWRRKEGHSANTITANNDISIPFILQMPMVQFPPSANIVSKDEGLSYHTNFVLTAYLDPLDGDSILKTSKSIIYMPFIETNLSKKPMVITTFENTSAADEKDPSISLKIHSLDYIPGDNISLSLSFQNIPTKSIESVSIRLNQVQTWNKTSPNNKGKGLKSGKKAKHSVTQKMVPFITTSNMENSNGYINSPCNFSINVPVETIPSFTYGPVFSLTYTLKVSVKRKGKLLSHTYDLTEIPITIGTLGYGIKTAEETKVYSIFKSVFNDDNSSGETNTSLPESSSAAVLPVPKFLDAIEYEDSLPVYIGDRLPAYDSIINIAPQNCIM